MKTILLVSAVDAENFLLRQSLQGTTKRLGEQEYQVQIISSGIGNLSSAVDLTEWCLENGNPAEVIFVGSAGVYERTTLMYGLSNQFEHIEGWDLESKSKSLARDIIQIDAGPFGQAIASSSRDSNEFMISTTNSPSSLSLVEWPFKLGFENLEAYGMAYVCNRRSIPFTALFALTNFVGPNGSADWQKNYMDMSKNLQKKILQSFNSI